MLKEMPKVGDIVRFIGTSDSCVTNGRLYEIIKHHGDGAALFIDDENDPDALCEISRFCFAEYELVNEAQPTPSVTDLIANLARRVSELEACLAVEQAHREDLTEQNAQQAYEINELYRAFVRKEAQI